jgi:hypothetical protein
MDGSQLMLYDAVAMQAGLRGMAKCVFKASLSPTEKGKIQRL